MCSHVFSVLFSISCTKITEQLPSKSRPLKNLGVWLSRHGVPHQWDTNHTGSSNSSLSSIEAASPTAMSVLLVHMNMPYLSLHAFHLGNPIQIQPFLRLCCIHDQLCKATDLQAISGFRS